MSRRAILRTVLLALAFVALDLVPHYGRPDFRYTGSDPAVHVWNVGWPGALWIFDARNGWHAGPFAYALPPVQAFLVLVWIGGERLAVRLARRARIRAALLTVAFLATNFVPYRGTPPNHDPRTDPPISVWNVGWPLALWFNDPNQGWSTGPGILLAPPFQTFLVVAWMLGEDVAARRGSRAVARAAVLAVAFRWSLMFLDSRGGLDDVARDASRLLVQTSLLAIAWMFFEHLVDVDRDRRARSQVPGDPAAVDASTDRGRRGHGG